MRLEDVEMFLTALKNTSYILYTTYIIYRKKVMYNIYYVYIIHKKHRILYDFCLICNFSHILVFRRKK